VANVSPQVHLLEPSHISPPVLQATSPASINSIVSSTADIQIAQINSDIKELRDIVLQMARFTSPSTPPVFVAPTPPVSMSTNFAPAHVNVHNQPALITAIYEAATSRAQVQMLEAQVAALQHDARKRDNQRDLMSSLNNFLALGTSMPPP
jgi:hypothetical protein